MPSKSEVGNAKNVANLQKLIEQVKVYTLYNPPVDNLKIVNLQTLYTDATAKLSEVEEKRNANKNAITLRQSAFKKLKSTCTKIINLLDVLGLPQGTLDQAKSLNRVIQGGQKKTTTPPEENGQPTNTISTSRQSYTQQADNFGILLQLVATILTYTRNEEDLKLPNLTTYQASLMSITKAVDQTEAELNLKLIERDQLFYAEGTGLYNIAQNVKKIREKPLRRHLPRICKCLGNQIHVPNLILKQVNFHLYSPFFIFSHPNRIFREGVFIFFHHKIILARCKIIFLPL